MTYKRLIVSSCFLFFVTTSLFSQNLLDYSNSLKYADYLFQNKQYRFSAIEYERVTYLEPFDTLSKLRLIQSYRLLNDLKNAKASLEKFFPECQSNYPGLFANENFRILFQDQQFQNAFQFLNENETIDQSKKAEYKLGALLMQNKWFDAKTLGDEYLLSNKKTPTFERLYDITLQGTNLNYKSPVCAALMSAIIPGSGKVYTKHWKDGIYAFLLVSTFSWLTYNSIDHYGINAGSILYGSIALSFYTATIYGSFKSAVRHNQKANKLITKDIEKIIFEN